MEEEDEPIESRAERVARLKAMIAAHSGGDGGSGGAAPGEGPATGKLINPLVDGSFGPSGVDIDPTAIHGKPIPGRLLPYMTPPEIAPPENAASRTIENQSGHCVHKSVLLVTGFRVLGVPSRLGLARVRNHLATSSLEARLGTDVLTPHGYAAFWNGDRWVKCTPVFNRSLCEKLGTVPLEWDPRSDTLFQPLDASGRRFMEYIDDYGLYSRIPMQFIRSELEAMYPRAFDASGLWSLPEH